MDAHWRARTTGATWCSLAAACAAIAVAGSLVAGPASGQARKGTPAAAEDGDNSGAQEGQGAAQQSKKPSPAEAKAAIDAAAKLLEAGKAEPAVEALSRTLANGRLPPAIMAKALLYRGSAYRQLNKPAQAIADLTSALWVKGGLGEADRADALKQRAAAYHAAGLSDTGAAAVSNTSAAGPTTGGWDFFGSLFGSSSSSPPPAPPQPVASPPAPPQPVASQPAPPQPVALPAAAPANIPAAEMAPSPHPPTATSAWTRNTQVHNRPGDIETATASGRPEGRFRIQIGMARTHDQAQEMAIKVKSRYGDAVGQREPEIDETVVGNMGSFYRVRIGPFASPQEGQAACSKLKGSGLDCLVVAQ
jgi:tetratricopeptide (TPR) repeat protein